MYGKKESFAKWLCLIPIIGGVAITVLKPQPGKVNLFLNSSIYVTQVTWIYYICPYYYYYYYYYYHHYHYHILKGFFEPVLDGGFSMGSLVGAMVANACAAFKASESSKVYTL